MHCCNLTCHRVGPTVTSPAMPACAHVYTRHAAVASPPNWTPLAVAHAPQAQPRPPQLHTHTRAHTHARAHTHTHTHTHTCSLAPVGCRGGARVKEVTGKRLGPRAVVDDPLIDRCQRGVQWCHAFHSARHRCQRVTSARSSHARGSTVSQCRTRVPTPASSQQQRSVPTPYHTTPTNTRSSVQLPGLCMHECWLRVARAPSLPCCWRLLRSAAMRVCMTPTRPHAQSRCTHTHSSEGTAITTAQVCSVVAASCNLTQQQRGACRRSNPSTPPHNSRCSPRRLPAPPLS
jgi:hypothetical protein